MEVLSVDKNDQVLVVEKVFRDVASFSKEEIRELICAVQTEIEKHPQIEVPITHHFSKGVYAREMYLKKGSFIVGKIHKFENLNILSKGEVSILSIDGAKRVKAPFTFVGSIGAKRVIYAHEDCVSTTIHGTNEKDVEKIEEEFIAKSYEELKENIIDLKQEETKCLG